MSTALPSAKQIKRAKIASGINQLIFAAWLITGIFGVTPDWLQGNIFWILLVVTLPILWPVMRSPEASYHLHTGFLRYSHYGLAVLMAIYFFGDMAGRWIFALFLGLTLFDEWGKYKKRKAERSAAQVPSETATESITE